MTFCGYSTPAADARQDLRIRFGACRQTGIVNGGGGRSDFRSMPRPRLQLLHRLVRLSSRAWHRLRQRRRGRR